MRNKIKAFSLMEVLLTISLLAVMMTLVVPGYSAYQIQVDMDGVGTIISQSIRTAQVYSQGPVNDSKWGVLITNSETIMFKGNNYASRDQLEDVIYKYPKTVNMSGLDEVVFSKYEGLPNNSGSIIFELSGKTRQIDINEKGQLK